MSADETPTGLGIPPNPIVELLPEFIQLLAIVSGDPALGARGLAIAGALNFAAAAIKRGQVAEQAFRELTEQVRKLTEIAPEQALQAWHDVHALVQAADQLFEHGR